MEKNWEVNYAGKEASFIDQEDALKWMEALAKEKITSDLWFRWNQNYVELVASATGHPRTGKMTIEYVETNDIEWVARRAE
jgi:predicted homoserine dehydrogenase-like protein